LTNIINFDILFMGAVMDFNISVHTHSKKTEDQVITGYGEFHSYPKILPREGRKFWEQELDGTEANGGVVIRKDGQVVAFCRYFFDEEEKTLYTCGTWVETSERNQKLAMIMWQHILETLPPKTLVYAYAVSKGGRGLFSKLQHLYPKLNWDVDGCRAA
jgi:hypothetical protein